MNSCFSVFVLCGLLLSDTSSAVSQQCVSDECLDNAGTLQYSNFVPSNSDFSVFQSIPPLPSFFPDPTEEHACSHERLVKQRCPLIFGRRRCKQRNREIERIAKLCEGDQQAAVAIQSGRDRCRNRALLQCNQDGCLDFNWREMRRRARCAKREQLRGERRFNAHTAQHNTEFTVEQTEEPVVERATQGPVTPETYRALRLQVIDNDFCAPENLKLPLCAAAADYDCQPSELTKRKIEICRKARLDSQHQQERIRPIQSTAPTHTQQSGTQESAKDEFLTQQLVHRSEQELRL